MRKQITSTCDVFGTSKRIVSSLKRDLGRTFMFQGLSGSQDFLSMSSSFRSIDIIKSRF